MPPPAKRSIGQVLPLLKNEFPDISISKIRFLESEGLVSPERAPSGYRRYAEADIDRLRYILRMQRDHYLPLKVIRQNLEMMDRGIEPPTIESPASSNSAASAAPETDPQDPATAPSPCTAACSPPAIGAAPSRSPGLAMSRPATSCTARTPSPMPIPTAWRRMNARP